MNKYCRIFVLKYTSHYKLLYNADKEILSMFMININKPLELKKGGLSKRG